MLAPLRELSTPALLALFFFQVASGALVAPLLSLFPVYVERHLGLSTLFSANIRILSVCAGGVVALVGGALCDALGRKRSYLLAMTGLISAGTLFLMEHPLPMSLAAVYSGLMFGLGTVAGLTYVMEASPRSALALATGCYFLTGTLGNAAGSAASGWIAREVPGGYALLGAAMVGGQALLLLAAWRLMPDLPRPEVPRTLAALAGGYGELFARPAVWLLLALRFLPTVYWGAVTFLMPLLLFRATGSEKPAGYYTAASLLVSAACQLAMGRVVDRYGTRVPVVAAISTVTLAALGQALFAGHRAALEGFGLLGAGAAWSVSIAMTTLVQELSTEKTKARLLGMTHVAWSCGFLAGTLAAGYLARERGQGPVALWVSGACCALAVACALGVVRAAGKASAGERE